MKIDRIIIHHSLTKDSETVSWGAIRDFHVQTNKFKDIGYHFGVENLRGQTEILVGRMPDETGAHCAGHNTGSIGICLVGNFDEAPPPAESWDLAVKLCRYLVRQFGVKEILGHTELNPGKSCPGKMFNMTRFRRDVFM